jgi:hypothetical protein
MYTHGRCNGHKANGKQCRWPADLLVGGVAVCKFHIRQAERAFSSVKNDIGPNHPVILAAERDTRERNANMGV